MRRLRYNVAMSLDGFIAGPNGGHDWIPLDPTIDFEALFAAFDTFLMGRRTYEALRAMEGPDPSAGREVVVASRTLDPSAHADVTVVADAVEGVARLKERDGRDIWLFGGGGLFGALLDAGLVDTVEVAIAPVLLGGGIPLLPAGHLARPLHLAGSRSLPSGIVMLTYEVER